MSSNQPLFIDVDTRRRLHQLVGEDTSYLLVGNSFNSASFTLHHVQKHVKGRCPLVIESASEISAMRRGGMSELSEDAQFTVQQLQGMSRGSEELHSANARLKQKISEYMRR